MDEQHDFTDLGPGVWFEAARGGKCSGCGDEFEVRWTIRADGHGGYEGWGCCGNY